MKERSWATHRRHLSPCPTLLARDADSHKAFDIPEAAVLEYGVNLGADSISPGESSRRRTAVALIGILIIGWLATPPLAAQQRVLDKGALVISRAGAIIGKEEFVVRAERISGERGWSISSEILYPAGRAQWNLALLLELAPDSQPASLQIEDSPSDQVFAELAAERLTIRSVKNAHESVRQYPAFGRVLLLDDSAFAVHAMAPAGTPGRVLLLFPRDGSRDSASWEDQGIGSTEVNGHEIPLRHVTLIGMVKRDLWYDEQGHLVKVEEPARGLTAVRASTR